MRAANSPSAATPYIRLRINLVSWTSTGNAENRRIAQPRSRRKVVSLLLDSNRHIKGTTTQTEVVGPSTNTRNRTARLLTNVNMQSFTSVNI
jgi:hypothetical protein